MIAMKKLLLSTATLFACLAASAQVPQGWLANLVPGVPTSIAGSTNRATPAASLILMKPTYPAIGFYVDARGASATTNIGTATITLKASVSAATTGTVPTGYGTWTIPLTWSGTNAFTAHTNISFPGVAVVRVTGVETTTAVGLSSLQIRYVYPRY